MSPTIRQIIPEIANMKTKAVIELTNSRCLFLASIVLYLSYLTISLEKKVYMTRASL